MTGYGLTGPMTARGTTFAAKAEAPVGASGTRYRSGYRLDWMTALVLLGTLLGS